MLHICPQLGVRFLADSNVWNANGTPNLRTVKQMLTVLNQPASDVLAQPGVLFAAGLLRTKFQVSHQFFYFHIYANIIVENRMYQQLQKIYSEIVCHKRFSDKISFAFPKIAWCYTYG